MTEEQSGRSQAPRRRWWALAPDDLLRQAAYRRVWFSVLCGSLGQQVTLLALPLTAALLLQATPTQMGLLTAMETLPFVLLALPTGVWLDRVRKMPVYVAGELTVATAVLSVPLAWWLGWLTMPWLYVVAFVIGLVSVVAGSAGLIVLTMVVPRERLVDAHARNALASSGAEVAGPGLAGALIKLLGAPLALALDAMLLLTSAVVLRGLKLQEPAPPASDRRFWRDLREGLAFVRGQPLLVALAVVVGIWQMCHNAVLGVQILYASRTLGLSEQAIGLCFAALGAGTITASSLVGRLSDRFGPGPCMVLGFALCGVGWLLPALATALGLQGALALGLMMVVVGAGSVAMYINFLALRQAVTPPELQGRMTTTMRWLILLPAGPGALAGGWLAEHVSLLATLSAAGGFALVAALLCARWRVISGLRAMPEAAA